MQQFISTYFFSKDFLVLVVKMENASRLALHAAKLSGKFGQEGASRHATVLLPRAPAWDPLFTVVII
jgi:hypothetical protein